MSDIGIILVAVSAFVGGLFGALMGWFDSHEEFNWRKAGKSIVFAALSGIGFAVTYSFSDGVGIRDIFFAVLSGAGVDSLSNRIIGAARGNP